MRMGMFMKKILLAWLWSMVVMIGKAQTNFINTKLSGATPYNPTSLQFGPDGTLYVATQGGSIFRYTIEKTNGTYQVTKTETINLIKQIKNHNDDGSLNTNITSRQITGLFVSGTAAFPKIYVTSSDPRIGGAGSESSSPDNDGDVNLDTNSGILSLLSWNGTGWTKIDLVRGLPRSEENHATNGLVLDDMSNSIYIAIGGMTNAGSPSVNFAMISEYALAACVLKVDLNVINTLPVKGTGNDQYIYDIPTLDDPTRTNSGNGDINDPFGGNDGRNQAKLIPGGPVQVFAPGFRNMYDLVLTKTAGKSGRLYGFDNGANPGWGGYPDKEGTAQVTNKYVNGEPGSLGPGVNDPQVNNIDQLHLIYKPGMLPIYGGHPVPVRANPAGAGLFWKNGTGNNFSLTPTSDWPPVPISMANPIEGDFKVPGLNDGALTTFNTSTNGITEYTSSAYFSGQMTGDLLATSFDGNIYRIKLNTDGSSVISKTILANGFAAAPLDITAQQDNAIFPGTIWVADYLHNAIYVLEPISTPVLCTGNLTSITLDDDADGYSNKDEADNATDPCSYSSKPKDNDGDKISDLNDPDDDNDGIQDIIDVFHLDAENGKNKYAPFLYPFLNGDPGTGLFGMGFTGLMSNATDPGKLFDETANGFIMGGAVGLATIPAHSGSPLTNTQKQAFQFGLAMNASIPLTIESGLIYPFFNNISPILLKDELHGIYIGNGDQDNYILAAITPNNGNPGIVMIKEDSGIVSQQFYPVTNILSSNLVLFMDVDPVAGTIQSRYKKAGDTSAVKIGTPLLVTGKLLTIIKSSGVVATGILATSRSGNPFSATWDFMNISPTGTTPNILRINTGGGAINSGGVNWNADNYFSSTDALSPTTAYTSNNSILGTTYPEIYQSERYGKAFSYSIPVKNAFYKVKLHFAEIYWDAPNKRVFNVDIENGQGLLNNLDIYALAGKNSALSREFIIKLTDGNINILFNSVIDQAKISGIEITQISTDSVQSMGLKRINNGGPQLTLNGNIWLTDSYFKDVSNLNPSNTFITNKAIANTNQQSIYQSERYGKAFNYTIPMTNGNYIVKLHFAEIYWTVPGKRIMNITIEGGQAILNNFDILGNTTPNTALIKEFPITITDSVLNIQLTAVTDMAKISGIEIIPNTIVIPPPPPPPPTIVNSFRINGGGPELNVNNQIWSADKWFSSDLSYTYSSSNSIGNTTNTKLYQTERYGKNFSYNIPVPTGTYQVTLHFAELYWNTTGSRKFNVTIENNQGILSNFDIYGEAGKNNALSKTFTINVIDGTLNIVFGSIIDHAKISGIEVIEIQNTLKAPSPQFILEEKNDPLSVRLQPNPFFNNFTLNINGRHGSLADVIVYTISGQIVEELKQVSVDQSIELGKMYEKGIYIIEVIQGGERAVVRVIKH